MPKSYLKNEENVGLLRTWADDVRFSVLTLTATQEGVV